MSRAEKWDIKCVIYDCDGVLFDSFDANRRLYNAIAKGGGRPPLNDDELKYCHTHTVFESIAHIFRGDAGAEQKGTRYFKDHIDFRDFIVYLEMEPHLKEVLTVLRNRGIHTAISTNRTTSMRHIMSRYGLWDFFDIVVTAAHQARSDRDEPDDREILQARSKPDPEGVGKILHALGVGPEATLYIGDSEVDMGTARSAGVRFIAYKNSTMPADAVINDHLALLDLLSGR
ncbi:MAG: HAD family hydrolase [Syntrophorhabdaceae bacterium]|nr:HAD family hydrolase [Syntrophorhabdaceae bacterium]MDD4195939.1 HAD family hydrolase [Syntrophorhabdaceae bacterium]HOC45094.1 HAD family hydrolase [Syntrophorhabdaceae bacterium]